VQGDGAVQCLEYHWQVCKFRAPLLTHFQSAARPQYPFFQLKDNWAGRQRVTSCPKTEVRPACPCPAFAAPACLQRVGYQCSAYYRDVVVAQGLIRDSRFRMTRGGRAVFVAGKEH
jgi:hypothetical protein